MTASKDLIRCWLNREKAIGKDYMFVVYDSWDYEDYPVYVTNQEFKEAKKEYSKNMQTIIEIYDLHLDLNMQLNEVRAWHEKDI